MRRRSIRFRITALAMVAVGAVLVAVSLALIVTQRAQLTAALDSSLRQRAEDIEALLLDGEIPDLAPTSEDTFVQIVAPDGDVVASTPNLDGAPPVAVEPVRPFDTVELPSVDEDAFRVLTAPVETPSGPLVLHVGASSDDVGESVGALALSLAVAVPIVVLILGWVVWMLVGRTLEPVERIRSEVSAIGIGDLERRVPRPDGTDEIARLAGTMNEMLDRLQASVEQQQRFVADASHELRSPLTRMRTTLEVELAHVEPGAARNALSSVLDDVLALQAIVEDLLHLARSDAGRLVVRHETVDLDDLVQGALAGIRAGGPLVVDTSGVAAVQVTGDRILLGRAVENLVDNAGRHARSRVSATLTASDAIAILAIEDDGPGIPPEERERVFERFVRLDESRSRDRGGTGLGLAIARDIVERHGGTITLESGDGGGTRCEVRLRAVDV